jgi:hypothetical protein
MAKREKKQSKAEAPRGGRIARMRSAITRNARTLGAKIRHPRRKMEEPQPAMESAPKRAASPRPSARRTTRATDVPLDLISRTYTPTQTSLKGPFRVSGDDQHRDQELAGGFSDERWNDEDRITNKSGDPRIGTHRRTYEPGERDEQRGGR